MIIGSQYPRILSVPPGAVSSSGDEAIELAATAGITLDQWQRDCLRHMLAEKADGSWCAFESGLVVPRQSGKGETLIVRELAGLFLLGEQLILHSAHLFETSIEHFTRLLAVIEGCPDLARRVKRVSHAHGDEGVELWSGARIRFKTRTKGGGRGFSANCVVIDEAQTLSEASLAALLPTLSARVAPQVIYCGSAVDQTVLSDGIALARLRERALAGDDPSLYYAEWSIAGELDKMSDADLDSHENWAAANPALGLRITTEHVANERRSMSARTFATERLAVGDWPSTALGTPPVIDMARWAACMDAKSAIEGRKIFAIDIPIGRETACIAVAGMRADGLPTVEIVRYDQGTDWVPDELARLTTEHGGSAVYVDDHGPAASMIPELERRGIPFTTLTTGDLADAAGSFYDLVMGVALRHLGEAVLTDAVADAVKRPLGERWTFGRKGADVSPLVASMIAVYGALNAPEAVPDPWFWEGPTLF
jgi:hypothetical protein